MVHDKVSEVVAASCEVAFDVVHDYERRLQWDPLLRGAFIVGGGLAGKGAVGGLRIETIYISFQRGVVAAVKMVNQPALFETWAASIRHEAVDRGRSRVTYTWSFKARPRWLAFALEPLLALIFHYETRRRLRALGRFLARPA
jgi:Polyketide cyclase / dehydrase and lipid transport